MRLVVGWVLAAAVTAGGPPPPKVGSGGAEAWDALRGLAGTWDARTAKGATVRLAYRFVANDSVLVETFTTKSGRETLTLFHLDGARLLATHYCAQGNQPRLQLDPASGTPTRLVFDFVDATNLKDGAAHLRRLEIEVLGEDRFRKTETYRSGDQDEVTVYECSRTKS